MTIAPVDMFRRANAALLRPAVALVPLAFVVVLLAIALVTGRGPIPTASGASTVEVTGSVAADVSIDTAACLAPSVAIGELVPGSDPWKTAQDNGGGVCSIAFGTTNVSSGVNLTVLEDPAAPASPADAMKCVAASCTGSALDDFSAGGEPAPGTSAFGAQLLASGGGASGVWPAAPAVNAVPDVGATACQTSATGTGTCDFTFGATASTGDGTGAYQAQVRYVVLAR